MKDINDSRYWREFENNDLTHSAAHYLMAIDALREQFGYARVTDVASMLHVSRGAASMALTQLKKRGWVAEDHNKFLMLSEGGKQLIDRVEQNYKLLVRLFEEVLGVKKEIALIDACKMEHLISPETGRRLICFLRSVLGDKARFGKMRAEEWCDPEHCEDYPENCPLCEEECMLEPYPKEV